MVDFTQDYIELCKNEKIQGLCLISPYRNIPNWKKDTYSIIDGLEGFLEFYHEYAFYLENGEIIWLPTGDQLDDEIVKICKENKWHYEIALSTDGEEYHCWLFGRTHQSRLHILESNPLIAKIKLLIQLLEVKE